MITVDFECLPLAAGCRVLDVGCGSGRHTAAAYDLGAMVVGIDPSRGDLEAAAERLRFHEGLAGRGRHGRWSLAAADITTLPFPDQAFDLVICSEVLEHIADLAAALNELTRVVKPGRDLVISVPRRWTEALCWGLSRRYRETPGGHIRIFSAGRLVRLCRDLGFEHLRTHHAHSLHTPYWWLKCLLDRHGSDPAPVRLYHRLLVWDLMHRPPLTRALGKALDPLLGKSVVLYFRRCRTPRVPVRGSSRNKADLQAVW